MAQQEETEAPFELKFISFFRFDISKKPNTTYSAAISLPEIKTEITEDTDSLEAEIEVTVQQIERIYPQTRRSSPGITFRLMSTNLSLELYRCMQQLDQLYEGLNADVHSKRLLVNAAYSGWARLQTKFAAENPKNHFIQRELAVWGRRQLETRSTHTSAKSSRACCCTIS
jgi:hypothetical protein